MRLSRLLVAAALAGAAFTATPASADCETNPEECYDCVMAPCYPSDWPPFLLDKVNEAIAGEGHVGTDPASVCLYRFEVCTA